MVKVTFVQQDGSARQVDGPDGGSLMQAARYNGVAGIDAECGGACACATCHVYVDAGWRDKVGEPGENEAQMLDFALDVVEGRSRLACQITLTPSLEGLIVQVPRAQQ